MADRDTHSDHHSAHPVSVMAPMSTATTTLGHAEAENASGVSWAAIVAGAVIASAATVILLIIGSGTGLLSVSPFTGRGDGSVTTVAVAAAVWLVVTQWVASGLGGYVTGRLRSPWAYGTGDEVMFRDTAHGLLAWSLATLVGAAMLGSAVSGVAGTAARGAAAVVQGAGSTIASVAAPLSSYDLDRLLRPSQPGVATADTGEVASEIGTIVMTGVSTGEVPEADRAYLARLVAARTNVTEAEARTRVDQLIENTRQVVARAQAAAETARKTAATLALLTALSLLIGAFIASVCAAYGGRLRDRP